jgi:hypothetical protein
MRSFCLFIAMLSGLLLSSCAGGFWTRPSSEQSEGPVISSPTDASMILSCLAEQQKLTHGEFKAVYKTASAQAADGTDAATLRLICLSLHDYASFKQLKSGTTTLANYIKEHRDADSAGLLGIQLLMQRIEKELTVKWTQGNKNLDEKERVEALEKGAVQDQKRIKELQNQIEQLKNIENIIKERER